MKRIIQAIAITAAAIGAIGMLAADPALAAVTDHSHASAAMLRVPDAVVADKGSSQPAPSEKVLIKNNDNDEACIDVPHGKPDDDLPLIVHHCWSPPSYNQQWTFNPVTIAGAPRIRNAYQIIGTDEQQRARKCVEVPDKAQGTLVVQRSCTNDRKNQMWLYEKGSGFFRLRNVHSNLCLHAEGTDLRQRTCEPRKDRIPINQKWSYSSE